jgi:hypothetical protein
MTRTTLARTGILTGAAACALAIGLGGTAFASDTAAPSSYQATLDPITANHVTGSGQAWITLNGTSATVKVTVSGLLDGAPHAQHIHVDGAGKCPTPAEAVDHNGHSSINVADAMKDYGMIGASLTTSGDTSPNSALAVDRFEATGSFTYQRTIELDPNVVDNLKNGTAVLVVHGIDYNGNGTYDNVLGASELDASLPAEATDPALCGAFTAMQMSGVPNGSADTGGGSMAAEGANGGELALGGLALAAAAGAGVVALRRRRPSES